MSYILDALTKSQQQRRRGDAATPGMPQWMPDPAMAVRARYRNGALVVLAGAAVLFAVNALTRQDEGLEPAPQTTADAPTSAEPAALMTVPSRESDLSPTSPEPGAPPVVETPGASPPASEAGDIARAPAAAEAMPTTPPKPARRSDIALTEAPIASPPRQAAPESVPPRSEASGAAAEGVAENPFPDARESADPGAVKLAEGLLDLARRPLPRPAPGNVFPQQQATSDADSRPAPAEAAAPVAPSSPDIEVATAAATSPAVARSEAIPAAAAELAGGDVLPSMLALPSEVQTSLGRLSINAHVYSDAPAGRMVIINMNRYQEGDKLREGPRVETITARGAILSYETYRFHLSLR